MLIQTLQDLKNLAKEYKKQGKKIWFTNGCFDILHPGHIEIFKQTKTQCDILIVWLVGDKSPYRPMKQPGRPINNQIFRTKMLEAIKYIDHIYIYDEGTAILPISEILPDLLTKWSDYELEKIIGYKEVTENGGKVQNIQILSEYSTTKTIEKITTFNS